MARKGKADDETTESTDSRVTSADVEKVESSDLVDTSLTDQSSEPAGGRVSLADGDTTVSETTDAEPAKGWWQSDDFPELAGAADEAQAREQLRGIRQQAQQNAQYAQI